MTGLAAAADLMRQLRAENPDDAGVPALFVRGMIRVADITAAIALQAAGLHQEHGLYHLRSQRWQDGRTALHRARDHYEALLQKGNRTAQAPNRLPKLLTVLAQVEHMCADQDAAMACLVRHQQLHPMGKQELLALAQQLDLEGRPELATLLQAAAAGKAGGGK